MMRVKTISQQSAILLLTIFCLTSCKKSLKELFSSSSYVTCNLNGEKYAADYPVLTIFESGPNFYYNFRKGKGDFKFDFDCYPEKEKSKYSGVSIRLCLFLDEPLNTETVYTVAALSDFHNEDINETIKYYQEKRQSYCIIEAFPSQIPFCLGNGEVDFSQINNPNEAYMGRFGFRFTPTSQSQGDSEEEMHLQGEFLITNMDRVSIEI